MATPCFACHKPDNKEWKFRNIGTKCIDCHNNIHEGFISPKFQPNNDCTYCHSNDAWSAVAFDHNLTTFALQGQHQKTSCRSCHFSDNNPVPIQKFIQLDKQCISCHDNIHGTQFEQDGKTDCARCHGFDKWDRSNFNHDNTRFKLEGAHLQVDCNRCHFSQIQNGIAVTLYRKGKLQCKDCHQ